MSKKTKIHIESVNAERAYVAGVTTLDGNRYVKFAGNGQWLYVSTLDLLTDRPKVRRLLGQASFILPSNQELALYLAAAEEITSYPARALLERPGWTAGYYAERTGYVHSPPGAMRGKSLFPTPPSLRQPVGGTLEQWRERVGQLLTGQDIPIVVILAALASPLVRFFEEENFGLELHGPGGKGKTLCQRIMQAVAGPLSPLQSFNATQAGLERLFASHMDMPLPINEGSLIKAIDRAAFANFAFNMSNGSPRTTAHSGEPAVCRFVYLTSSNESLHHKVGQADAHTEDAALQRLIPIRVSDEARGVFNFVPPNFASSRRYAKAIEVAIKEQFGTPYRELLRQLVLVRHNDAAKFDGRVRARINAFTDAVGASTADDGEGRITASLGLLYAVGCFAKDKGILPREWDCLAACVAVYRNFQSQRPGMTPLAARLATIIARPDTLDIRRGPQPKLSDKAFERHGAFISSGIKGRTELLMTRAFWREHFPDGRRIVTTDAFRLLNCGKGPRGEGQRRIRAGRGREWFVCFKLPTELIPPPRP